MRGGRCRVPEQNAVQKTGAQSDRTESTTFQKRTVTDCEYMLSELAAVPAVFRFPLGLIGAVLAVGVMDQLMARTTDGTTPPSVAASVLTGRPVDDAPPRLASVVHYLAGVGTGLLFVYFSMVVEWFVGGSTPGTVVGTTILLYLLMVAFFVVIPLPRAVGVDAGRRKRIGRAWAIAAAGYLLVLVPATTGLTLLFAP